MFNPSCLKPLLQYLQKDSRFHVAYSGGLDSHVLLHALAILCKQEGNAQRVQAIHINHGWNPRAAEWAEHCKAICEKLGIHYKVISVDAKAHSGKSWKKLPEKCVIKHLQSVLQQMIIY